MAAPPRQTRKNYIGIVHDTTEAERVAVAAARSEPDVVSYLVGRLADALRRRPGSALAPPSH